jgi:hypothetical protein
MKVDDENASKYNGNRNNSIDMVTKKSLNTSIFDVYADLIIGKKQERDLNEMYGTCKRGDIKVVFPVSLKKTCYLEQTTEAHINKLISKTLNEDSISLLIEKEVTKASNLSEAKSKSTAAGYGQLIHVCYLLKFIVCLFN